MNHVLRRTFILAAFISFCLALVSGIHDPQGAENSDCMHAEKFSNPGPADMSISGHTTVCSPPTASIATYVYVHPTGLLPTSKNLVFRYSQRGTTEVPKIRWIDSEHVLVEARRVESISKEVKQLDSVSIMYKIGLNQ